MVSTASLAIVLAVVVAGGGASTYFVMNNDDGPETDYSLLGDTANIGKGLTIHTVTTYRSETTTETIVVKDIRNGMVTYEEKTDEHRTETIGDINGFIPKAILDSLKNVNYQGKLEITHGNDTITINGEERFGDEMYAFANLTVSYGREFSVSGKLVITDIPDSDDRDETEVLTLVFAVSEHGVTVDVSEISVKTETENLREFFGEALDDYDYDDFRGISVKSTEKFGNIEVDVYTVNDKEDGKTYEDFRFYVYNGLIIKAEGSVNEYMFNSETSVYRG